MFEQISELISKLRDRIWVIKEDKQ
jgi:hypothetical protein